jgi:hypothetical protein
MFGYYFLNLKVGNDSKVLVSNPDWEGNFGEKARMQVSLGVKVGRRLPFLSYQGPHRDRAQNGWQHVIFQLWTALVSR